VKQAIQPASICKAIGPYSQAVRAGNFIYVSGQLPFDAATGSIIGNDIAAQTKKALENLYVILHDNGYSLSDVVKTTVYLKDLNGFEAMNEVYAQFFIDEYPARAAFEVARLPKDAMIEIEAIAYHE
jgi:2-iminobutanoate/2-iminopropanoate deaminase